MNLVHRWYCKSDGWARLLRKRVIPWALEGVDLGDHVLEIGPGPGRSTDWLRRHAPNVTGIEIDRKLASALKTRMKGTNATIVEGDATDMPFPEGSFSCAVSFTMLHHVPSPELQDRLLAEAYRVLKPGGWFAGTDSRTSLRWRLFHLFDTCVPVEPDTLASRLKKAGFADVEVDANSWAFRFRARKPPG